MISCKLAVSFLYYFSILTIAVPSQPPDDFAVVPSARSCFISWKFLTKLEWRGPAIYYKLILKGNLLNKTNTYRHIEVKPHFNYVEVDDLFPFTWYVATVRACNEAGCSSDEEKLFQTNGTGIYYNLIYYNG